MAKKGKKRGRPVTTGKGEQIVVRVHQQLLEAIDDWRAAQEGEPTRADALRRFACEALGLPVEAADQKAMYFAIRSARAEAAERGAGGKPKRKKS